MSEKKCIVSADMRTIIDTIYPVGAYFWSGDDKDPSTFLGGAWEQVKDRFVLAAGDSYVAGSTGGEAAHTLTVNEMPSHRHAMRLYASEDGLSGKSLEDARKGKPLAARWSEYAELSSDENTEVDTHYSVGGSKPHNNMPPYITAYCWHRTA